VQKKVAKEADEKAAKDPENPDDPVLDWDDEDPEASYAMLPLRDAEETGSAVFEAAPDYSFANADAEYELLKVWITVDIPQYDEKGRKFYRKEKRLATKTFPDGSIAVCKKTKNDGGQRANARA